MARAAQKAMQERKVEVKREKLLVQLEDYKESHIADYEEAMQGYKESLREKIREAFEAAKTELMTAWSEQLDRVDNLQPEDIPDQPDFLPLMNSVSVQMQVPRCYAAEYDAAIDMAKWETNETLKLTYAEFQCFVRDQWDWTDGFAAVTQMYKAN